MPINYEEQFFAQESDLLKAYQHNCEDTPFLLDNFYMRQNFPKIAINTSLPFG